MAYLDTCVLVPYYCPEPLSQKVQDLFAEMDQLVISPLTEVEIHFAMGIKHRTGAIQLSYAKAVLAKFAEHMGQGVFRTLPITLAEYNRARDWLGTFSSPLRTVDALHMAAAANHDVALLTADRALAEAAETFGVECQLIE